MLGTVGAMPFSVLTLPELLLGELGPEPGALLHAESAGERQWLKLARHRWPHWLWWECWLSSLGFCLLAGRKPNQKAQGQGLKQGM
jgi:hypothetical protein